MTREGLGAAGFAGAVAIHDASFGQIVGRHFEIDAVAKKNFDAVATQASGEVGEDGVPVFELNGERCARVDLPDGPEDLERRFFGGLGSARGMILRWSRAATASYDWPTFGKRIDAVYRERPFSAS